MEEEGGRLDGGSVGWFAGDYRCTYVCCALLPNMHVGKERCRETMGLGGCLDV